ncbi:MAG: hypothetical protein E7290_02345 [Lachnospiraceae bacterium]|nr:hypothetical protein [Lachnospiraceae bacterium]
MKWDEYYEKINDWAVSTAVNKISSLENIGAPDEIVDALYVIAYEDEKGAIRLLNKALQNGIKFSGEKLVEIKDLCGEECFKKAFYQSAENFTKQDLEELHGCIDDELIIEVGRKYHIAMPEEIMEEHEEELCTDLSSTITWDRFYDLFNDWSMEFAIVRSKNLKEFGTDDEVMEVAHELFCTDKKGASDFICRALEYGVKFDCDNILEMIGLCDEETIRRVALASGSMLDSEDLEELYGEINDELISKIAHKYKLELPEDMREKTEDNSVNEIAIANAVDAADCALIYLMRAQSMLNDITSISVIDLITNKFAPSLMKNLLLNEAEYFLYDAQNEIDRLNGELKNILYHKTIRLKYSRLTSLADIMYDTKFLDRLTYLRLNKALKRIRKVISQIEAIRRELERM